MNKQSNNMLNGQERKPIEKWDKVLRTIIAFTTIVFLILLVLIHENIL